MGQGHMSNFAARIRMHDMVRGCATKVVGQTSSEGFSSLRIAWTLQ